VPISNIFTQSNYFSSYIDIKAISAPSNPSSGIGRIYHNSADGKLYFKTSDGTTVEVGAGTPTAHATSHKSGGSDPIKLDELAAPTDVTTLNSSTTAHGLLRKLTGGTTNFLREDGTWAAPPGAGGGISDIASANDVTFTSLQDEDLMRYDDAGAEWINGKLIDANVDAAAAIAYSKLNLADSIVNADINSAAAIAYSKLNLSNSIVAGDITANAVTTAKILDANITLDKLASNSVNSAKIVDDSIVNADINSAAAIVYSKLSLTDSIVNADVNSSAAIAYSKLNLTDSIVDADINSAAAIATSKLADSATILLTTNAKTVTNKTIDSINNTMKNLGSFDSEVFSPDAGTTWYARNTKTGVITSTDTDLTVVLQAAIDGLTAARTNIETVKVRGTGTIDSITVPSFTRLDFTDAKITWLAHADPTALADNLITNDDHVGGNTNIEIIGGIIDGNRTNQFPYTASPPLASLEIANIIHFEGVTNGKVLHMEINNTPSRAIRFLNCINCVGAYNTSDLANAEALMIEGGESNKFLFNHITNSLASFITTGNSPNTIIHGNYGDTNTGVSNFSGYNTSSLNTIFTNNIGINTGSAVLTMSEAGASYENSYSIIEGNDLSGSRAAEGISCLSGERTGIIFRSNQLHNNFRHGIRVAATKTAIQMDGNMTYENGYSGIAVNSGASPLIPTHISIHNNICFDNGTEASANAYETAGIALYGTGGTLVDNVSIIGNHCFDTDTVTVNKTQLHGIYITETDNTSIVLNKVVGNKTNGIGMTGTNSNLRIFENPGYSSNTPLATTTGTETLTNKTLTSPTIATIINGAGTLTLPNITTSLVGRTTVDTLTNKTLTSPTINSPTLTNSGNTLTLPTTTDTLVGRATTDTMTNKTLTSPTINSGTISGTVTIPVGGAVGDPLIFQKTAASGADGLVRFQVSDDTTSYVEVRNGTSSDTNFSPELFAVQKTTFPPFHFRLQATTDSGTNPLFLLTGRIGASTAVATRPLLAINNVDTAGRIMQWNVGDLQFYEAYNMQFGTTTGTKIGTTTSNKLAFYGSTPITQGASIADISTSATGTEIATAVNALISRLEALGLIATV
jgi:hypothetical protein